MVQSADFKANGKLLITGEYLVLHSALALALPLKFGQRMRVTPVAEPVIRWISEDSNGVWLSGEFDPLTFSILQRDQPGDDMLPKFQFISELLRLIKTINQHFPFFSAKEPKAPFTGAIVYIYADYPLEWGMGSSSTLLSLLAQWADIDVFSLFCKVSKGSGYDVVSATQSEPFFYKLLEKECSLPYQIRYEVSQATPGLALRNYAYFGYLGNKQDSVAEVNKYLKSGIVNPDFILRISELSKAICTASSYDYLKETILEHEQIISEVIGKQKVGEQRFAGLPFAVKSLGAWGGDFAMFVSDMSFEEIQALLASKGVRQLFTFNTICI